MNPNDAIITVLASGKILRHAPLPAILYRDLADRFTKLADEVLVPPSEQVEQVETDEQEV